MDKFAMPIFRYQYREPQGKIPCDYLESTQNIRTLFMETGRTPLRIVCREVGGSSDNHVQWVSVDKIVPAGPDDNDNDDVDQDGGEKDKRDISTVFRGTAYAHGVIRHPSWQHSVGDKIWLRSDIPLFKGRKAVPIVNLTQGRSAEAYIRDIDWIPQKRSKGGPPGLPSFLLTIAGPKFPYFSPTLGPHRMAIVIDKLKETHAPLPTYNYPLPPPPSTVTATHYSYSNSYRAAASEQLPIAPAEREVERALERVDEERARLDNDEDHYTLKIITVDELAVGFEDVVDVLEVSVTSVGMNTRRRRKRISADNRGNGEDEMDAGGEDGNLNTRNQMLAGLVVAFSGENLGLDLSLPATNREARNDGRSGEVEET
ncbi:hypothetical protein V8F20_011112 [Naviculisporaceae sp. PSN 640]